MCRGYLAISHLAALFDQVTSLRCSAKATASARLETPSLERMWLTCALAVERLTPGHSARALSRHFLLCRLG